MTLDYPPSYADMHGELNVEHYELPARPRPDHLGPEFAEDLPESPPFEYPDGYSCSKCNNTGIKISNGRSCRSCYAKFASQDPRIKVLNPPFRRKRTNYKSKAAGTVMKILDPPPYPTPMLASFGDSKPILVQPGDPAIGGTMCGRCRGQGVVHCDLIYETTCKTCKGLGRLI